MKIKKGLKKNVDKRLFPAAKVFCDISRYYNYKPLNLRLFHKELFEKAWWCNQCGGKALYCVYRANYFKTWERVV